ncbi:MAG TPA: hypothetical protein VIE67_08130 [Rudaea sp.]|jgi:hypothetical protein|uniref:hypothetical protein n=1 Tax=Rudaea sp. TaxID=2136325 RepID=UPI002F94D9F2
MKILLQTILLAASLFVFGTAAADTPPAHAAHAPSADKVTAAREAVRDLWTDHIFWVRDVVMATAAKNASERKTGEAQVVANAKQIAGVVGAYYGKAAGDQMFTLLAGHWGAIKGYLDATYANDENARNKAFKDLNDNAAAIATFLSGANPNLPKDTLLALLTAHGAHHVTQITEVHAGDYDKEAANWAAMRTHMNTIADALVGGIAKQFPDKF